MRQYEEMSDTGQGGRGVEESDVMPMWGRMLGRGGRSQHYDRGIRLFDQGLYEQSIEAFQQALLEPKSGPLLERLARFYLAESYSALALAQINQNQWEMSVQNLREAILLSPNYADLHYHLGNALLNMGKAADAVPSFERALEINPGYARARLYLGVALYAAGRRAEGLECAAAAVALDPTFHKNPLAQAREADARGDHELVAKHLRRIGETEGDEALFHARVALDLFRRGLLDEAILEYRQALSISPEYADLRNQLGVTLHAAGRDTEAVEQFAHALRINPRYLEARLNHAVALQALGKTSEARAELLKAQEMDPDNHAAQEALAALNAAQSGKS
jgi:tetratricopeptide (TPR) repeat protein